MDWKESYKKKMITVEEAAAKIKSGDTVSVPGGPSAPYGLLNAIGNRYEELSDVTIATVMYMSGVNYLEGKYRGHINNHSVFLGPLERIFMPQGNIKVTSCNLSLVEDLFVNKINGNVVVLEVSAPDRWGYMSFGPGGTASNAPLLRNADTIIAQVNNIAPYVYGLEANVHVNDVDWICESHHDVPILPDIPIDDNDRKIASHIVEHIPDGATIQLGLGAVANAVGFFLDSKKDLGIHTEMITDSMMHLTKKGVITCKKKGFHPGKITFGFGVGSKELYEFMDRNPILEAMPIYIINDINNIAQNDNFMAINNALTVDLTGQVCSESLGHAMYSSTGGQLDFMMGATRSKGGKSFIALNSASKKGGQLVSRICLDMLPGTVVTTPRSIVKYVVTEWGIADLWLKSIDERVKEMISIAHPDFRDQLGREAMEAGLLPKSVF